MKNNYKKPSPIRQPAKREPGEIMTVRILNALEDPRAKGKARPGINVERVGGHFRVMGLTTSSRYSSGKSRLPVPDPQAIGLTAPCHFWGDRLTNVSAIDVGDHIGWIDHQTLAAMRTLVELSPEVWTALERAADLHHPRNAA